MTMIQKVLGIVALAAAVAVPASTFAATFAYVNNAGEVATVEATDANTALATAPGISLHSGVMLLSSGSNTLSGQHVGL